MSTMSKPGKNRIKETPPAPVNKPGPALLTPDSATTGTTHPDETRRKRIGKPPQGDIRLSVNISRALHRRLRIEAARRETTVGQMIEAWIEQNTPDA